MSKVQYYLIGGCVRDKILGLKPKDFDYVCVCDSYEEMRLDIISRGGTIFLEKPEYLTIRAKLNGLAADFVVARSESGYSDGRRPDSTSVGSLESDQRRRDFCMNAIAQDADGSLIDPFNGVADIEQKVIRCVGSTKERFNEDSLRMLRAIRFSITKGFRLDYEIVNYIINYPSGILNVSSERIREELHKCFSYDTLITLRAFDRFSGLREYVFGNCNIWLKPTSESV